MALLEEEPRHSIKTLLLIGIPSFILAVALSLFSHQYAHKIAADTFCHSQTDQQQAALLDIIDFHGTQDGCAGAALAGPVWTFGLALFSFALLLRQPQNLFFASMAFVNATIRLPETITVFLQLLINNNIKLVVDESSSLSLIRLHDMTIPTVIMCFYTITAIFFAIIVVHDIKKVPYKWVVAFVCFLLLGSIENVVWDVVKPLFI